MATYFEQHARAWIELHRGVLISDLHRYPRGGGAALFRLQPGAALARHKHPTGEHGYVISGTGQFGEQKLQGGDAFWMDPGDEHEIVAITELVFFAASLPRAE